MPSSLSQAQADLQDHEHDFYAIVEDARREYLRDYRALLLNHSKRTEANILHDLMEKAARERLEDREGFHLSLENNLFLICYQRGDRRYAIKLKKLDESFHASNIPTQTVIEFRRHQQLYIAGMGPATNLHLGYQREDDSPELLTCPVLLACPDGEEEEVAWHWELQSGEAASAPATLPDTVTPTAPTERRVRIRTTPDEETGSNVEEGGS